MENSSIPLFLRRAFQATVGAVVDMQKSRVSFRNIDENVLYKAVPLPKSIHLDIYIGISDEPLM